MMMIDRNKGTLTLDRVSKIQNFERTQKVNFMGKIGKQDCIAMALVHSSLSLLLFILIIFQLCNHQSALTYNWPLLCLFPSTWFILKVIKHFLLDFQQSDILYYITFHNSCYWFSWTWTWEQKEKSGSNGRSNGQTAELPKKQYRGRYPT